MFGGLCFMVDDKMCLGIVKEKLMVRIGPENQAELEKLKGAIPMDFTKRPMKGMLYITPDGIDYDRDLEFWILKCLEYNPLAKASKKKKK